MLFGVLVMDEYDTRDAEKYGMEVRNMFGLLHSVHPVVCSEKPEEREPTNNVVMALREFEWAVEMRETSR